MRLSAIVPDAIGSLLHLGSDVIRYVPFRDPLAVDEYWLAMMLPLVIAIAIVYKTIKLERLSDLPREATFLTVQIIGFMAVAAGVLWAVTELV